MTAPSQVSSLAAACAAVAAVVDPELPPVTIEDLGVLRDVAVDRDSGRVTVTITPTYAGCPALDMISGDIRRALRGAGFTEVTVAVALAPAWTTDWITAAGRDKLAAAGIAPPGPAAGAGGTEIAEARVGATDPAGLRPVARRLVALRLAVRCPHCGSPETEQLSRFGSTACKALWRCRSCAEPFDAVKAI